MVSSINHEYYFNNKAISIPDFKESIRFFKKKYDIISLDDVFEIVRENGSLKKKLVVTFDDGFIENYTTIAPILIDENIRATFFIISNCIDNKDLMWRNKLLIIDKYKNNQLFETIESISKVYNLPMIKKNENLLSWSYNSWLMVNKEEIVNKLWNSSMQFGINEYLEKHKPYCTSNQIIELFNNGFTIGSHSMSHPLFNKLSLSEIYEEISVSAEKIGKIINNQVNYFSYPFGMRASNHDEKQFLNQNNNIYSLLGIRNTLKNTKENLTKLERDNVEFSLNETMFRFYLLPLLRRMYL